MTGGQLILAPERCDRCGRCVAACPKRAVRVGGGYIFVDVSACDSCMACVEVCASEAISRRTALRPDAAASAGAGQVVVGSRAEAKALRRATSEAERARNRAAASQERSTATRAKMRDLERADAAEGRVPWTLLDAAVVLAVMLASLFASDLVMGSAALKAMPVTARAGARSAVLVVFYLVQFSTLVFLAQRRGTTFRAAFGLGRLGRSAKSVAGTVGLVTLLLVGTRLATTLWGVAANAAGWPPPAAGDLTSVFGKGGVGLALAVLTVVVVGPITEELAFRGVVLRAFGARWGMWAGVISAAVIFSVYHLRAWTFVPLFLLGLALGWLAWTRRSLWSAVFLHAFYNGIVVAAAYWMAR